MLRNTHRMETESLILASVSVKQRRPLVRSNSRVPQGTAVTREYMVELSTCSRRLHRVPGQVPVPRHCLRNANSPETGPHKHMPYTSDALHW